MYSLVQVCCSASFTHARTHAHTHARTHAHTHRPPPSCSCALIALCVCVAARVSTLGLPIRSPLFSRVRPPHTHTHTHTHTGSVVLRGRGVCAAAGQKSARLHHRAPGLPRSLLPACCRPLGVCVCMCVCVRVRVFSPLSATHSLSLLPLHDVADASG